MREHDVAALSAAELEAARRELAASVSWLVNPAATRARRSSAPRNAAGLLAGSCMRHPSARSWLIVADQAATVPIVLPRCQLRKQPPPRPEPIRNRRCPPP